MPSNRSHSKAQAIIGSPTKGTKNAGRWKDVWKMVKARRQATNAWRVYNAARVNFQWYFAFHIKTEDVTPLRQAKPAMMNDIHALGSETATEKKTLTLTCKETISKKERGIVLQIPESSYLR